MPTFRPGHDAHWIQARQAFENNEGVELAPLLSIDTDSHELVVRTKAGERRYWCARAADAAAHLDHALAVPDGHVVILNEGLHLLALLVGETGADPPATIGLLAAVSELEDGAAIAVPTTDDQWMARLYCLSPIESGHVDPLPDPGSFEEDIT